MKVCPRCRREYPDNLNFCFDDGKRLEESASGDVRVCPKCLLRFSADATECHRDQIPLLSQAELERARERVCSECGAVAADPSAEFCGADGARVVARWEVGLVPQTAVSPARSTADTRPDRPPGALEAPANLRTPRSERSGHPDEAGATTPGAPPEVLPARSGSGSAWFLGEQAAVAGKPSFDGSPHASVASGPSPSSSSARGPSSFSAQEPSSFSGQEPSFSGQDPSFSGQDPSFSGQEPSSFSGQEPVPFEAMEPLPTRVSRPLIGVTIAAALLFFGALAFALYARSPEEGKPPPPTVASKDSTPPPAVSTPPPAVSATAPVAKTATPETPAATPTPPSPAPKQPAPEKPTAKAPPPKHRVAARPPARRVARRRASRRTRRPPRRVARRRVRRRAVAARPESDPSAELAAALRRAAEAGRAARPTPSTPSPSPAPRLPPAQPAPAPSQRLSRADANRYFRDAAREYGAGRPGEALRRFRIIERLGPRDRDLQGRVLLNMAHIYMRQRRCSTARRYYQRAVRTLPRSSSLRTTASTALNRLGETCK